MENEPTRDPQLWEALEACRPGHDDLAEPEMAPLARQLKSSPELASLYGRLQRLDAALADAFRDVSVPEGLEGRILARLSAEAAGPRLAEAESVSGGPKASAPASVRRPHESHRRWLLLAGSLTAAAATLLAVVFGFVGRRGHIPGKWEVLSTTIEYHMSESGEGGQILSSDNLPPPGYPLSPTFVNMVSGRYSQIRWRFLPGFPNRGAVRYDLLGPEGGIASVYVTNGSIEGLPAEVPPHPMHSTGEISVSAWQEDDRVYVLVVDGGAQAYERLLLARSGPLA